MIIKKLYVFCIFLASSFNCHANKSLSKIHFENGTSKSYKQLLKDNKLAGISVAIVNNYETIFVHAEGKKNFSKKETIDTATSFNAASISKPVIATLAVMLSEQGILDLDVPVNNYLKSWKLPKSDFTKNKDITLRHLLTHTAGTSQSGYSSKHLGETIPTINQTLNMYKNKAISISFEPGSRWKYSGGGFLITQVALEDVTGKKIAVLANELLFKPLNMQSTTFYQHGHQAFPKNVAKAHNSDREVISTGIPICPESACGLWTNAIDMAKLSIEMQKALSGAKTKVISKTVAEKLIKIQTTQLSGGWSLGWMRNVAVGNLDWFSHSGYNNGTGGLIMSTVEHGRGIFIFGNGAYRARVSTIDQIVYSVIQAMNWKREIKASQAKPSKSILERAIGNYENMTPHHFSPFAKRVRIKRQGNSLLVFNSQDVTTPLSLIHTGHDKFRIDQFVNSQIGFKTEKNGVTFLTLEQPGTGIVSKALVKLEKK